MQFVPINRLKNYLGVEDYWKFVFFIDLYLYICGLSLLLEKPEEIDRR